MEVEEVYGLMNGKVGKLNRDLQEIANSGVDTTARTAIGTLANLTTVEKADLVGAINEVNAKPSGGGSGDMLKSTYDTAGKNQDVFDYADTKMPKSNLSESTNGQIYTSNGDGTAEFKTVEFGGGMTNAIDVRSDDPTGDDLYNGRVWIISPVYVTEADTLDQTDIISGSAARGKYAYKVSLNYRPTENISLKKIIIKMKTSTDSSEHSVGNAIRCRVCADNGSGLPNESSVLGTINYTGTPATLNTIFNADFSFTNAIALTAGSLYHFVLDVPTGTGNTFYQTFLCYPTDQSTNDAYSMQVNYGVEWLANHEEWAPTYKIIKAV